MACKAYATGCHSPLFSSCIKTAPSPYDDASEESFVGRHSSRWAKVGVEERLFFGLQMLAVGLHSITSDFSNSMGLLVAWKALLFVTGTCLVG